MRNITESDFIITATQTGVTVRWKHNNRAIKTFKYTGANKRAKNLINFLIEWYRKEGWKIDSQNQFYKGI